MTTRKKLHKLREQAREQKELEVVVVDPTRSSRWRQHNRDMAAMLRGINPDRFERLSAGDDLRWDPEDKFMEAIFSD